VSTVLAVGLLISCLSAAATGQTAVALTLDDYFAQALVRSEVVATQSELIRQAEERYRQANAAILPTLSGIASYTWLDSGAADTATNPTRQPHARLTGTQPLFRGFREFAAIRQSQALVGAQSDDYQNARVQLFKDVAQNFYDVLTLEQDLKNLDEQIGQYQQREKELQERVRIGRTRPGEVLTVQATISTLRAQVEQARTQLSTARDIFAFLSGLPGTTPLRDTEDDAGGPGRARCLSRARDFAPGREGGATTPDCGAGKHQRSTRRTPAVARPERQPLPGAHRQPGKRRVGRAARAHRPAVRRRQCAVAGARGAIAT
jgi:outer membrane protein